jgi:hypothetical protein
MLNVAPSAFFARAMVKDGVAVEMVGAFCLQ